MEEVSGLLSPFAVVRQQPTWIAPPGTGQSDTTIDHFLLSTQHAALIQTYSTLCYAYTDFGHRVLVGTICADHPAGNDVNSRMDSSNSSGDSSSRDSGSTSSDDEDSSSSDSGEGDAAVEPAEAERRRAYDTIHSTHLTELAKASIAFGEVQTALYRATPHRVITATTALEVATALLGEAQHRKQEEEQKVEGAQKAAASARAALAAAQAAVTASEHQLTIATKAVEDAENEKAQNQKKLEDAKSAVTARGQAHLKTKVEEVRKRRGTLKYDLIVAVQGNKSAGIGWGWAEPGVDVVQPRCTPCLTGRSHDGRRGECRQVTCCDYCGEENGDADSGGEQEDADSVANEGTEDDLVMVCFGCGMHGSHQSCVPSLQIAVSDSRYYFCHRCWKLPGTGEPCAG